MDKRSNAANHDLCHFSFSDGRRCRMLRHPDHPGLCPFHSREERQRIESERIGTELAATLTGHFLTATDINHVLGKVFTALAQDRISIKKAKALCYAAQLMLASLRYAKQESQIRYSHDAWLDMLKNATHLSHPITTDHDDATTWDRHRRPIPRVQRNDSPNGVFSASERSGGFTSPSASAPPNVGAVGPEERGNRAGASSTAASLERRSPIGDRAASTDSKVAACPPSPGGPTFRSASSIRLTNATNEDTTKTPDLTAATALDRFRSRRT